MTVIEASSLLGAAIAFARRGWPVFPCSPANKRPLLPRDKDAAGKPIPRSGGVSKATTDEAQIRAWWTKWPQAMIGLAAGDGGLLILDFDPREDEDEATGECTVWTLDMLKAALEEQMGCALPVSLAVRTPSGGVHVYFRMPDGEPIGNRGNLPAHVDVRGKGGYVIAPPSICVGDGDKCKPGSYTWLRGDAEAAIAELPEPLVRILREPTKRAAVAGEAPALRPRPAGTPFTVDLDAAHRRYALAAMDRVLEELKATPRGGGRHGGRNKGAYQAAFNLGGFVGAGALNEGMVRAALISVVRGFDPASFDRHCHAIDNGLTGGIAAPHDLSGIGQMARGASRSVSASAGPAPFADPSAYEAEAGGPGRAAVVGAGGGEIPPFHSGKPPSDPPRSGGGGRIAPASDPEIDRQAAFLPMTDLGNAERFRLRFGGRFRFCPEVGWFAWDGRRWELLSEEKDKVPGAVSLAVFETVRAIRNEADLIEASGQKETERVVGVEGPEPLDFIVDWKGRGDDKTPIFFSDVLRLHAKASEAAGRIGCIAGLAKSFSDIAIRADAMDADRMAINVLNGTLRVHRVEGRPVMRLHRHDPADLISKIANVIYDPTATCPIYDRFLETVQPDAAIRRFLAQWGGLSLTGDIGCQKLVFHYGVGRNGKSTLNDLWGHVAGDYGATIAIETFLDQGRARKGGEATPDLARLPGVRFLRTSEPEKGAKLAEALIKLVTGGEPIDARHLNKGFFTFLPSFKLSVQGNHKPKITGHDDGIWRRMLLVPWGVQIAKDQVDPDLPAKLRREASGVLNRLLAGLIDWQEHGLVEPDAVAEATAKYREQSDQLGRFLAECTRPKEGARAKSSIVFAVHNAWAKATGAAEWQQVGFTKAMEDRGFEKKASNGMQWLDIELIKSVDDFAEGTGGDAPARDDYDPGGPRWGEDDFVP